MKNFMAYGWPGNIRELKSALEYAFVVTQSGVIQREDLPSSFSEGHENATLEKKADAGVKDLAQLDEKAALLEALRLSRRQQDRGRQASRGASHDRLEPHEKVRPSDGPPI